MKGQTSFQEHDKFQTCKVLIACSSCKQHLDVICMCMGASDYACAWVPAFMLHEFQENLEYASQMIFGSHSLPQQEACLKPQQDVHVCQKQTSQPHSAHAT